MISRQRYKTSFGFIDLLMNLLVGFAFMFILAFMLINPVAKKHEFDPKAEYLIIMTWNSESNSDIDIWIKDNLGHTISFRQKDQAMINLDRDDLGLVNDRYRNAQGELIERNYNREVISIRTKEPRRYLVTVHYYSSRGKENDNAIEEIKIELLQLNPWNLLQTKIVVLEAQGQEIHIFEFNVDDNENVTVEVTDSMIINAPANMKNQVVPNGDGAFGPGGMSRGP